MTTQSATLIGAGIAGVCLAHALVQRGWQVTLIEKHPAPAMGASGNPAGVVRPQLTLDNSYISRLSRQAFLYTVNALPSASPPRPSHTFNGLLHLARDAGQAQHLQAILAAHDYPDTFARWATQDEASDLAGTPVSAAGVYFPQGGWMSGARVAETLLAETGHRLTRRFNHTATRLEPTGDGWRVWENEPAQSAPMGKFRRSQNDRLLSETRTVVLTGAHEAMQHAALPLEAVRGQITVLPDGSLPGLNIPIACDGYVLPTCCGIGNIGASFAFDDDAVPRPSDQTGNLERLARMLAYPPKLDAQALAARVSFRAATPDRMPLVGAVADTQIAFAPETVLARLPRRPGLFALTGLGARGLTLAPFLAQALAARLNDETSWLPNELWQAIDPARFLLREVRRRKPN